MWHASIPARAPSFEHSRSSFRSFAALYLINAGPPSKRRSDPTTLK
jgi:hypothetical protein